MKAQTLMLITDISGYTRFITRVGHDEGLRHAQDLLQIIINSNTLGLKLCEVEGDAVFFYTMQRLPSRRALLKQISKTYRAFNDYLALHHLETELGLKFFVHTGECEEVRIGGRTKLFGLEVIRIHRLLKSISKKDDHLLITDHAATHIGMDHDDGVPGVTGFPHLGPVRYIVYNEEFLRDVAAQPSLLQTAAANVAEAMEVVTSEFAVHFRRYAALLYPLQSIFS